MLRTLPALIGVLLFLGPTGKPQSPTTTAVSSHSIKVDWSNIIASQTMGLITGYRITWQRTDKQDLLKYHVTSNNSIAITGLDEYVDYDFTVAGMNRKGLGPYTDTLKERTLEASKCPILLLLLLLVSDKQGQIL